VVEGARLLSGYTVVKLYRGFESHPLRHIFCPGRGRPPSKPQRRGTSPRPLAGNLEIELRDRQPEIGLRRLGRHEIGLMRSVVLEGRQITEESLHRLAVEGTGAA
jgi:hypothetical protein